MFQHVYTESKPQGNIIIYATLFDIVVFQDLSREPDHLPQLENQFEGLSQDEEDSQHHITHFDAGSMKIWGREDRHRVQKHHTESKKFQDVPPAREVIEAIDYYPMGLWGRDRRRDILKHLKTGHFQTYFDRSELLNKSNDDSYSDDDLYSDDHSYSDDEYK